MTMAGIGFAVSCDIPRMVADAYLATPSAVNGISPGVRRFVRALSAVRRMARSATTDNLSYQSKNCVRSGVPSGIKLAHNSRKRVAASRRFAIAPGSSMSDGAGGAMRVNELSRSVRARFAAMRRDTLRAIYGLFMLSGFPLSGVTSEASVCIVPCGDSACSRNRCGPNTPLWW